MNSNANHPADENRYGGLAATIWRNPTGNGRVNYNVTITRSYRLAPDERDRGDSGWREAGSLRRNDLLAAGELFRWAYDRIRTLEQADHSASPEEEAES